MDYTPREIAGHVYFERLEDKAQRREALVIGTNAARGEPKDIKKQLKELERE